MTAHVVASALSPRLLHGVPDDADPHLRVDGTAVVVDISGFTALSEQLAAAGREGTEQLIATLSRIFTVLLPSSDDGGDVVKFAGDALFVLFQGADHAKHAAHAAWNMNRVLAAIGDIHLPSARTKLRMSVGVHSGTYEFVLSGDDVVSVILTGAATTRVLELQDAAEAGRILVSDETAALLPASQVAKDESAAGGRRLLKAGSVASAALMALSVGRTSAADRFLPRTFAQRPDLLGSEPDHRWAAIAFVQVEAPDAPGPEDIARMQALTLLVEAAAADSGVTLLDIDPARHGYRFFLTAGAPTTVEDPEGRLLTAVLRIVQDGGPGVRAGLTSGRVFAGFVGATYRQTYTVMGDPTNLAARLAARAETGTVLATRSAVERTGRPFDADDRGTITVKGKSQEIPVVVVTGHGGLASLDARQTPFVGRLAELEAVRGRLAEAAAGVGSVTVLSGPAGIGKTRLLDHALEETPLPVLRAHGDRYGANAPYRTLQTLLRPLLGIPSASPPIEAGALLGAAVADRAPHLSPWLPLLAPAVRAEVDATDEVDALDDAFRAERASAVLREFIETVTAGPGCLVLDDAQWIDPASAAVLGEMIAADAVHAIFVSRREDGGALAVEADEVALGGLDDDDAGDLIEAVAGRRMLPADLAPLVARAGGTPLYLVEIAAGLASEVDGLAIEQLVGERIDALSESDRTILRRAAVLGVRIPLGLYLSCVGAPLLSSGLSSFLELGADGVSFRSELFRDVAYGQLMFQARRELHRAAAAAISSDPGIGGASRDAMLTAHYEAAGEWEAAREAASRAAASAESAFALEEAVRAYRSAIEAARRSGGSSHDLPALLEALGRVSVAGGWAAEGLEAFSSARKLMTDAVSRARLDRERAYALNILGRADEAARALRSARRAVAGAGDGARGVLAAIAVTESGLELRKGHWAPAKDLAVEAIELLEGRADDATSRRVLADAYRYHDIAASEIGGDGAMIHLAQALEMYDQTGDELSKSKVLSLLGVRAYYRGDWGSAAALYGQARAAADAAGDVVGSAIEAANAAEILLDQGLIDEARPLLRAARRVFEASDNPYLVAFVLLLTGRCDTRAGDPVAARAALEASAAGYAELDEADSARDARVHLLEALIDAGLHDDAVVLARDLAVAGVDGPALSRLHRQTARLARADGDDAAARAAAQEAVDVPTTTPYERALSLALLAHLDPDAAIGDAHETLRRLGVVDVDALLVHDVVDLTPSERPQ